VTVPFDTKRRKLEHQFEVTKSELREEYLAAVLEIHDSPEAKNDGSNALTQSRHFFERRCALCRCAALQSYLRL
jgi:hypothetical protein